MSVEDLLEYIRSFDRLDKERYTKAYADRKHAEKRLQSRLEITDLSLIKRLKQNVRESKAKLISKQTNTRKLYESEGYYFIYSKSTKEIVTFLKKEWVEQTL